MKEGAMYCCTYISLAVEKRPKYQGLGFICSDAHTIGSTIDLMLAHTVTMSLNGVGPSCGWGRHYNATRERRAITAMQSKDREAHPSVHHVVKILYMLRSEKLRPRLLHTGHVILIAA